jgi:flagellar protein FliL
LAGKIEDVVKNLGEGCVLRKIILAAVGVLLLGGGGAGAYFVLLKKPAEAALPAEDHATAEAPAPADDHAAKEDDGHGGGAKDPIYVRLDPLVVPVMDSEGISQTVSMVVAFEVTDEETGKKLEAMKPRIKDAMIQNMYGMLNYKTAMDNGVLKVGYVKDRLNTAVQKVAGEGVVKDVLLQMVQQNPI